MARGGRPGARRTRTALRSRYPSGLECAAARARPRVRFSTCTFTMRYIIVRSAREYAPERARRNSSEGNYLELAGVCSHSHFGTLRRLEFTLERAWQRRTRSSVNSIRACNAKMRMAAVCDNWVTFWRGWCNIFRIWAGPHGLQSLRRLRWGRVRPRLAVSQSERPSGWVPHEFAIMNAKILVVDDEPDALELVRFNLKQAGFEVCTAADGEEALKQARLALPDVILLDIMLPEVDGLEVCKILRRDSATAAIPIIMLTAKAAEIDRVLGLELGADDYVTKPFSMSVLAARVGAVLRRSTAAPAREDLLQAGPISIDTSRHSVQVDGQEVTLTQTEFRLLMALAAARGKVLSRNQLVDQALGMDAIVTDRTIDVHLTSLRRKLGPARESIKTVRGIGYRLES